MPKLNFIKKLNKDEEQVSKTELVDLESLDDNGDIIRYSPDVNCGLNDEQVNERISNNLTNKIKKTKSKSYWQIFATNIFTFFNIICGLIAIALIIVDRADQLTFLIILTINTIVGIIQEIKAKKAIDSLSLMNAPSARVTRNGCEVEISVDDVVLDDIVHLKNGNQIPCDAIIIDGYVEVNESILTGEARNIKKGPGDRLLCGSYITSGSCRVKADKVGKNCYMQKLQSKAKRYTKPHSEILKALNYVTWFIILIIVTVGPVVVISSYKITDGNIQESVAKTAASIVGMIPAGLFMLVTVALAVSVINLSSHKALVQELYCIEMLARVDCICIDKTGTITDGTMNVSEVIELEKNQNSVEVIMANYLGAMDESSVTGAALKKHFGTDNSFIKEGSISFSSERKLSAVTFKNEGTYILGAPEFVCPNLKDDISSMVKKYSSLGYRVLLLACSNQAIHNDILPSNILPLALIVLEDHIRDDSYDTIKWFQENGVEIKVISGDNPATVSVIAQNVNINGAKNAISLEGLSPSEVEMAANNNTVFGRVLPEQKALLIKALKAQGKTVAMIGDGVNDILAMKVSDCSIAMAAGSDAAMAVSHLVLLDSSFSSMPHVVFEGRKVINNIQRSASLYLMKTILTMVLTLSSILFVKSLFPNGYPFVNNNFLLMEMFLIGIPSYVLTLQPNKEKLSGSFLKNVLINSVASAVCLILSIAINFFVSYQYRIGSPLFASFTNFGDLSYVSSFAALTLPWVGFAILINLCRPINKLRGISLVVILAIITTISFTPFLLTNIFDIQVSFLTLTMPEILLMLSIFILTFLISWGFNAIIYKRKNKQ